MLEVLHGDCLALLATLPIASVQCCVTSPPYWRLRDYGVNGQLGLEQSPEDYVTNMVAVFREVRRVLRDDGTLWLNLGDSYASDIKGSGGIGKSTLVGTPNDGNVQLFSACKIRHGLKAKDLVGIPWRVAFALQADGWYLRSDIIWHKPDPMPESVIDRPTKSHEYIFLLTKSERYFYDAEAIREPALRPEGPGNIIQHRIPNQRNGENANLVNGLYKVGPKEFRNKRTVWTIATQPYAEAHFATFPEELPKLCILAGSKPSDTVLDPFAGSGTTGKVAIELGRKAVLIELNPTYIKLVHERCNVTPGFANLLTNKLIAELRKAG